jgi:hypothetical protein
MYDNKENRNIIQIHTVADINVKVHHLDAYHLKTQTNGENVPTHACKECHSCLHLMFSSESLLHLWIIIFLLLLPL